MYINICTCLPKNYEFDSKLTFYFYPLPLPCRYGLKFDLNGIGSILLSQFFAYSIRAGGGADDGGGGSDGGDDDGASGAGGTDDNGGICDDDGCEGDCCGDGAGGG